jgi:hypothetical protein
MNNLNNTVYSVNDQPSYVQNSFINNNNDLSNTKMGKSFIDSKPMIQGLVRSVLKVEKNG